MIPTPLYTRSGCYVATVLVPPMTPPPEIVVWGSRMFVRAASGTYSEGIAWWVQDVVGDPLPPTETDVA